MNDFSQFLEEIDREVRRVSIKEITLSDEAKLFGNKFAQRILRREKELSIDSIEEQGLLFELLFNLAHDSEIGGTVSAARQILIIWSKKTLNRFGEVYSAGWTDGHVMGNFFTTRRLKDVNEKRIARTVQNRVTKAAIARRGLGDKVRAQIEALAPECVGMTKDDAALVISKKINKQFGTVRKYLSSMYPPGRLKSSSSIN